MMYSDPNISYLIDRYGSLESALVKNRFDPKRRLADVADKIEFFLGNSDLESAQLVLLADSCHPDDEQKKWRGEIGSRVKNETNIILCEGIDARRWVLSPAEKVHCLGEQFLLGPRDDVRGWDEGTLHRQSLQIIQTKVLESNKKLRLNPADERRFFQIALKDRNQKMVDCILQNVRLSNGIRVIVTGGSLHVLDEEVLKQFEQNNIKYIVICPIIGLQGREAYNQTNTGVELIKKYYRIK